jgi:guanidinopropionase
MIDNPNNELRSETRFSGIATLMRAPLARDLTDVDIALVGVPFDGAVENRPGARHGPREVRNMSSFMRNIHHVPC